MLLSEETGSSEPPEPPGQVREDAEGTLRSRGHTLVTTETAIALP